VSENPDQLITDEQKRWMLASLSNDESSSDEELKAHFVSNGIPAPIADQYISRRADYLNGEADRKPIDSDSLEAGFRAMGFEPSYEYPGAFSPEGARR
jgi:hypothetical protein